MARGPDRYESLAAEFLECFEPKSRCKYIVEQHTSRYDLDWYRADGSLTAVEVSATANPVLLRDHSARERLGSAVERKRARRRWLVHPRMGANLKRLKGGLDEALANYEAEVAEEDFGSLWSAAGQALESLGVEYLHPSERHEGNHFIHLSSGPGVYVRAEAVHDAALRVANAPDNLHKLQQAETVERHMVVCVDASDYETWAPLTSEMPPSGGAMLPGPVTQLWVLTAVNDTFVAWWVGRGQSWVRTVLERRRNQG